MHYSAIPERAESAGVHTQYTAQLASSIFRRGMPSSVTSKEVESWYYARLRQPRWERPAAESSTQGAVQAWVCPMTGYITRFGSNPDAPNRQPIVLEFEDRNGDKPVKIIGLRYSADLPPHRAAALRSACASVNSYEQQLLNTCYQPVDPKIFENGCGLARPRLSVPLLAERLAGMIVSLRLVDSKFPLGGAIWRAIPVVDLPDNYKLSMELELNPDFQSIRLTLERANSLAVKGVHLELSVAPRTYINAQFSQKGRRIAPESTTEVEAIQAVANKILGNITPNLELETYNSFGISNRFLTSHSDAEENVRSFEFMKALMKRTFPEPPPLYSATLPKITP